jgi:hypothetical protein
MPLTLTLTEGVIPTNKIKDAIKRLSDSMLSLHQLTGNTVMTPNVTAPCQIVPQGRSFSGEHLLQCGAHRGWNVEPGWNRSNQRRTRSSHRKGLARTPTYN